MAKKTELDIYEERSTWYEEKRSILEERILLLKEIINKENNNDNSDEQLKVNSYKMEVIGLQESLEGVIEYWNYYNERAQAIRKKEEDELKECEENFKPFYDMIVSVSPMNLKQYPVQIQQQYDQIVSVMDREHDDPRGKILLYASMKDLLKRMKKIQ